MNFQMILLVCLLCLAGGFALGMHWGFQMGFGDGYNDAVADLDRDDDISETRWLCTDCAAPVADEDEPTADRERPALTLDDLSDATRKRLADGGFKIDSGTLTPPAQS